MYRCVGIGSCCLFLRALSTQLFSTRLESFRMENPHHRFMIETQLCKLDGREREREGENDFSENLKTIFFFVAANEKKFGFGSWYEHFNYSICFAYNRIDKCNLQSSIDDKRVMQMQRTTQRKKCRQSNVQTGRQSAAGVCMCVNEFVRKLKFPHFILSAH